jgi:hypothetical protein
MIREQRAAITTVVVEGSTALRRDWENSRCQPALTIGSMDELKCTLIKRCWKAGLSL